MCLLRLLSLLLLLCSALAIPAAQAQGSGQGPGQTSSGTPLDSALRALGSSGQGSTASGIPAQAQSPQNQPFPTQPPFTTTPHSLTPLNGALRRLVVCNTPKDCPNPVVYKAQQLVNALAGPTGQEVSQQLSATQAQVTATSQSVQAAVTAVQASAAASQAGAVGVVSTAVTNSQPLIDVAVQQLTASQAQLKTLVQDLGSRLEVAGQLIDALENEPPGTLPLSLKYLITGQVNDSVVFAKSQAQKLNQRLAELEQALAQAAAAAIGTAGHQHT